MSEMISKEKLFEEFTKWVSEFNSGERDMPTWNDAVSLAGSCDTVKCIPVEWIEDYLCNTLGDETERWWAVANMLTEYDKQCGSK